MMKKNIAIAVAAITATAFSCKQKDVDLNPVSTTEYKTYGSMAEIDDLLSVMPKAVVFDAATGASFYGNSGTRYSFKPNSFQDGTGATVTGNVQVEVTEWLTKGDMLFSGALPMSNGEGLASGGEYNVSVTQNGNQLFLRPGMSVEANIPQKNGADDKMLFFKGDATGNKDNKVNWRLKEPDTIRNYKIAVVQPPKPSTTVLDTLKLFCDTLGYGNCDRFIHEYGNASPMDLIIEKPATKSSISLRAAAFLDNLNWVCSAGERKDGDYSSFEGVRTPMRPVHFVVYGLIDGHFYGGITAGNAKTGEKFTVKLTEVEPAAFKGQVGMLQ